MKALFYLCLSIFFISVSCQEYNSKPNPPPVKNPLDDLPKDFGGNHQRVPLGSSLSPYGYYIYTPSGYTSRGPKFPLLIFLHGWGQIGNSQQNVSELDKVLKDGPPQMITTGLWSPQYPMIVVSAQCHDNWWDSVKVKKFIGYIRSSYQVDTLRVYLTGLSMGGSATYDQMVSYGRNSQLTAAVPIAGTAALSESNIRRASEVPFWAFHGQEDQNVSPDFSKKIVSEIHIKYPPAEARLTMFSAIGHNCWTITYSGSGMGQEDPAYDQFSPDIYAWMLKHSRASGN